MITIRRSEDRGQADHGWLKTYHTFSFADYFDREHMGFRALRVINTDEVGAGEGFGTHPHANMEIVTYVTEGALEHKDSMGNGSEIRPGDIQRMSAGTGVTHSEFNPLKDQAAKLLQIWILPEKKGITPSYEQKHYTPIEKTDRLKLVASRDARDGSVKLHQDVDLYASLLSPGKSVQHVIPHGRHVWLQLIQGQLELNGQTLRAGDGAALSDEKTAQIVAPPSSKTQAEFLLFDLS